MEVGSVISIHSNTVHIVQSTTAKAIAVANIIEGTGPKGESPLARAIRLHQAKVEAKLAVEKAHMAELLEAKAKKARDVEAKKMAEVEAAKNRPVWTEE